MHAVRTALLTLKVLLPQLHWTHQNHVQRILGLGVQYMNYSEPVHHNRQSHQGPCNVNVITITSAAVVLSSRHAMSALRYVPHVLK